MLQRVPEEDCERFYKYYLHDFVRRVHICKHRQTVTQDDLENLEYEVGDSQGFSVLVVESMLRANGRDCLFTVYVYNYKCILWTFGVYVANYIISDCYPPIGVFPYAILVFKKSEVYECYCDMSFSIVNG